MSSLPHQPTPGSEPDQTAAARVEQLYASHYALVRSVCRSVLRGRVEAEDAAQQTFLSAHRALLNGSSPRDPTAWLVAIARHESFARVQALMREPLPAETETEPVGQDAYATAVGRHEVRELSAAISELPAQQREALLLREMRGLSYEEVASTLSVSTSAVESLLFRARRSLQVRLQESRAALSPAGLLRDLAARLGGGFAAPVAAKALALGVGAAVVTGGAVVGPQIIGLGHAPLGRSTARAASATRASHGGAMLDVPSRSRAQFDVTAIAGNARDRHDTGPLFHGALASQSENSDHRGPLSHASSEGGGDSSGSSDSGGGGGSSSSSDSGSSESNGTVSTGSGNPQTTSFPSDGTTTESSSQSSEPQTATETTTTSTSSDSSGGSGNTDGSTTTTASGSDSSPPLNERSRD